MSSTIVLNLKPIKAWHFLPDDGYLANSNNIKAHGLTVNGRKPRGQRVKVKAGNIYAVDKPISICYVGLHGSVKPLDALTYAPGAIV